MSISLALAQTAADSTAYLAEGLGGDGTSNNAITSLVNRVTMAAAVIAVGIFAVLSVTTFAKGGGSAQGSKDLLNLGGKFVIVMVLIFGAWALARIGASLAGGALS